MIHYIEDLRGTKCANPDCTECADEFYLHGRCHIESASKIDIDLVKNIVAIKCHECNSIIANIALSNDNLRVLLQMIVSHKTHPIWACFKHIDESIHFNCDECEKFLGCYKVESGLDRL